MSEQNKRRRIPPVKQALIARNEARQNLERCEADLQLVLGLITGEIFTIEGVPFRVCGVPGNERLYVRRVVGREVAQAMREAWRAD